ncbi:MAG: DNA recombination protein RmuC [Patescibacteria group bacterium]|jgi:DNA recombination protein RmuC
METYIILLLCAILGLCIWLIFARNNKNDSQNILIEMKRMQDEMNRMTFEQRQELQTRLDRVNDSVNRGMTSSHDAIQKQFSETTKVIQDITQKMTEINSTNKQVLDFSSQLQNLQEIFKSPKQRGVVGEYFLETLLSNVLPKDSFSMQYPLGVDEKTNQKLIADAVIFIRGLIIPIDSKFSLENYNRMMGETDAIQKEKNEKLFKADVKNRIDETAKYIQVQKNTMNFAFMFIPAEGVYYNLMNAEVGSGVNSRNLVEYAFQQHVMIVSPTSFYAYLQTVLLGLRELQLEKSTQEILRRVSEFKKHMQAYADVHDRLGRNLDTVVNQYNQSNKELGKLSRDVVKISDGNLDEIIEIDDVTKTISDT